MSLTPSALVQQKPRPIHALLSIGLESLAGWSVVPSDAAQAVCRAILQVICHCRSVTRSV